MDPKQITPMIVITNVDSNRNSLINTESLNHSTDWYISEFQWSAYIQKKFEQKSIFELLHYFCPLEIFKSANDHAILEKICKSYQNSNLKIAHI